MPKITFIGAGSLVFTRNLCSDILLTPALQDATIALMDINAERLAQVKQVVETIVERRGLKARIEASTDRRVALRDSDYVITTFQQGGLDAYALDISIPQRYGVEQCVGDTLGPGGVFRALRTIPVLLDICDDLDDVAPAALILNYVNPMAMNCWAIDIGSGRPYVGLCHSVQGTSEMLASWAGVPYAEVRYHCAGINHQAFFLSFRHGDQDLYPAIRAAAQRPEIRGSEPVRIDLMEHFGYFVTESSGHASEYAPYFRKSAAMVEEELAPRFTSPHDGWFDFGRSGGYLRHCQEREQHAANEFAALLSGEKPLPMQRSHEYGSAIIEAIETNRLLVINGNVPNNGLIDNVPAGCCVEVPCLVDGNGIQPTAVGALPPQLAALNRTNINVQELAVHAALSGDIEAVHHALLLDPLTAAVCTLPQIRALTNDMLEAQERWLPQFKK
ncbi:alpha-glucosidase/alpha-galactosidase [Candidatus Gracilibacteria bacterium]|nr:alpha-glucosidase/alpha-galactosidase [Candidatus Gracilibacteria bacterium]